MNKGTNVEYLKENERKKGSTKQRIKERIGPVQWSEILWYIHTYKHTYILI
jgi:hypothetical protein